MSSNTTHGGHGAALDDLSRLETLDALKPRGSWTTGQLVLSAGEDPESLPAAPGQYVAVKALAGNEGPVVVSSEGAEAGWPLHPGQETGLLPLANAELVQVAGAASDAVAYYVIS